MIDLNIWSGEFLNHWIDDLIQIGTGKKATLGLTFVFKYSTNVESCVKSKLHLQSNGPLAMAILRLSLFSSSKVDVKSLISYVEYVFYSTWTFNINLTLNDFSLFLIPCNQSIDLGRLRNFPIPPFILIYESMLYLLYVEHWLC